MAKTKEGLERGDILVALGKTYIYADPNDAAYNLEADTFEAGTQFGVATGITKNGDDGFAYTEMVFYIAGGEPQFDLNKYYVLQSTYKIAENPDYDYNLNKKTVSKTVSKGLGDGFTKVLDLLTGILGIPFTKKVISNTNSDDKDTVADDTGYGGKGKGDEQTWFQRNKFAVILTSVGIVIVGIAVWVSKRGKKKVLPTTTSIVT